MSRNPYRSVQDWEITIEPDTPPLSCRRSLVGTTTALIIGGIAAAGSSVASGAIASRAAGKAAKTQAEAAQYATDIQHEQWLREQENVAPWLATGQSALNALSYGMGLGTLTPTTNTIADPNAAKRTQLQQQLAEIQAVPDGGAWKGMSKQVALAATQQALDALTPPPQGSTSWTMQQGGQSPIPGLQSGDLLRDFSMADFEEDPGYQFRLAEGQKGIDRSLAAKGGALSGGAVKASIRYNSGMAAQEYANAFNRYQIEQGNKYNRLAGLAGVGQQATQQLNQSGQNYANNVGNLATDAANARASAYMTSGNAWSNAIGNAGNSFLNAYLMNQVLKQQPYTGTTVQQPPIHL